MKFDYIFWINDLNLHVLPWIECCGKKRRVLVVAAKTFSEDRTKDGWYVPEIEFSEIIIAPSVQEIYEIIDTNSESVNLFLGINAFSLVHEAFKYAKENNRRIGVFLESGLKWGWKQYFRKLLSFYYYFVYEKHIDFILPMGYLGVKWLKDAGFSEKKIFPFLYANFSSETSHLNSSTTKNEVVNLIIVAQCVKRKNIATVLKSLHNLRDLKWLLTIVGEGKEKLKLMKLSQQLNISDKVVFLGSVSNKEINRLFSKSDFSILPSLWDGWGTVVNESLMAGTPVVCSIKAGAACLLVDQIQGDLFNPKDIYSLTNLIKQRILSGKLTTEKRDKIKNWSSSIEAESVSNYLINVIDYTFNDKKKSKPIEPWLQLKDKQNVRSIINIKKVLISYHYLAHYRLPIFTELIKTSEVNYTFISGTESEIKIEKIPIKYASLPIEEGGLRWDIVKNIWFFNKTLLWQKGLVSTCLKGEFDKFVFLGNPYFISTWLAAIICRIKGKKVYFWMHGINNRSFSILSFIKIFLFYRISNGFFLYGNRAKEILSEYSNDLGKRAEIVYNSLNYNESKSLRKYPTIQETKSFRKIFFNNPEIPIICFIGRVNKTKKLDFLILSQYKLIKKFGTNIFNLIITGEGEELKYLKTLVSNYGLDNSVTFTGAEYEEKKISNLLIFSDLCVVPGEIGLTSIHALSYGTPVISHNNLDIQMPEVESIVEGKTGSLYKYNNVDDLATQIEKWLIKYPIKDREIIDNCYKIIDDFYNPSYQIQVFNNILK